MPDEEKDLYQQEAQAANNPKDTETAGVESDLINSLYKPDSQNTPSKSFKNKLSGLASKKFLIGGMGGSLVVIALVISSLFSFLNIFKLEHIMRNIEGKAFMRYQVAMDHRSSKWINAYLKIRLGEIDDPDIKPADRKNIWFRADKVDTNNPLADWYKTMRTSNFEDDLYKKHGIKLTSAIEKRADGTYKVRWAKLKVKDDVINLKLPEKVGTLDSLDPNKLNGEISRFIEEFDTVDTDKAARKLVKDAVNSETKSWQVIKRRHLRKNIQNMLGIRDWRFFEKTRDKLDDKKRSVRNKIIAKALPEDTVTGKFIQCIFGMVKCEASSDPSAPENQASGEPNKTQSEDGHENSTDEDQIKNGEKTFGNDDAADAVEAAAKDAADKAVAEGGDKVTKVGVKTIFVKELVASIIPKVVGASNAFDIASWVDTFARISKGISNKSLIKLVTLARGTQAVGLFSLYMTAGDQLKTGEVTGQEVGDFMQTMGSVSNSEGWASVINNSKETTKAEGFTEAKNKEEYCSATHQEAILKPENRVAAENEFHYLCGSMQIGGTSAAASITNWWGTYMKPIVGPLVDAYDATGLGSVLGAINDLVGKLLTPVIDVALKITGLGDDVQHVVGWLAVHIASALGAGPMMDGNEPSGVYVNQVLQGGSYTAESSARAQGAMKTTAQTAALARKLDADYKNNSSKDLYQKYIALDNPDSTVSNLIFDTVQDSNVNNIASMIGSILKRAAKAPLNLISGNKAKASTDDPYAAAKFAGIDTYDFPPQCYDLDPLTMTPEQVTNADENGIIPKSELTWDLVNNNQNFYAKLYENLRKIESDANKVEEKALKIYNCAAMDTTVRGGLGFMYGYTDDNGLVASSFTSTTTTTTTTAPSNKKVYILGDSLTAGMRDSGNLKAKLETTGFIPTISGLTNRRLTVGGGGVNSGYSQLGLDSDKVKEAGTIVLALGTNDLYNTSSSSFKQDLQKVYDRAKSYNSNAAYYWVNYCWIGAGTDSGPLGSIKHNNDLNAFASANNIKIIDWHSICGSYISSGVHPDAGGYVKMANLLVASIGGQVPENRSSDWNKR